jgi:2-polyprenyl-3-methyl-5-hydroxy-6-metoxy-1,4-benzoquinol methylase
VIPRPDDLATRDFWDKVHMEGAVPQFGAYRPERILLEFIETSLHPTPGDRLLEVGAGNSAILPILARQYGYRVAGLDYSPIGVRLARRNLVGINSDVREADLFEPPSDWTNAFQVVASFGVVEHFDDTTSVIRSCARYLADGGTMLTLIPNMRGLPGFLQRRVDHQTYDRHLPLSATQLANAHHRAGLHVIRSEPVASFHGSVVNELNAGPLGHLAYRALWKTSRVLWAFEDRAFALPPSRFASPWIVCVAKR